MGWGLSDTVFTSGWARFECYARKYAPPSANSPTASELDRNWDEFSRLANHHKQAGNIESSEMMYASISITIMGIEEIERITPQESRAEKRDQFLRAVYDLSDDGVSDLVEWEDVAPRLGWDTETFEHKEQGLGIAKYLAEWGLLTLQGDGSLYTITAAGIDKVETAIEEEHLSKRQQETQQFLRAIYSLSDGNPAEFVYWQDVADEMGWNPGDEEQHRRSLAIADKLKQGRYITIEVEEGDMYRITARGLDQVEGRTQVVAAPYIRPQTEPPPQIQDSLRNFRAEYTNSDKVAFIMMQFIQTPAHDRITEAIKAELGKHGITGVRADDREYHHDMFPNVETYMHGCGLGIAVFERIEADTHNPNVALEVGYLFAMGKPVCLLKDRTLPTLPADLVGRLYREFDPQNPAETIPAVLSKWLSDRNLA